MDSLVLCVVAVHENEDHGASVREYVFYVFFRFQKHMTFYVFLK